MVDFNWKPFSFLLIVSFIIISGLALVSAEQTVKTINVPLGYEAIVNANEIKYYNLSVDYPDGINRVLAMEILVQGDFLGMTDLYGGFLAGETAVFCEPDKWTVFRDADNYEASFDCTPILQQAEWKGGDLTFVVMSTQVVGNLKPRVQLTYENNPTYSAEVHGTEYRYGDEGKIFIQLLDDSDLPIETADCFASIYYPNDEIFQFQQAMSYVEEGIYDYDFEVPAQIGVYPVSSFCFIEGIQTESTIVSDNFESGDGSGGANWSSDWELNGAIVTTDNSPFEGAYHLEIEGNDNPKRNRSCDGSCQRVDYSFAWRANGLANTEDAYIYLIDSEGTEFEILFIDGQGDDDNTWRKETGSLSTAVDGFVFNNNTDQIFEFRTTGDWDNGDFAWIDDIELTFGSEINSTDTNYQIVRGSGEVHVKNDLGESIVELQQGQLTFDSLVENFTFIYNVTSLTSANKTGQEIEFTVWKPFPCNNILSVRDVTGTPINYAFTGFEDSDGRCQITIEAPLDTGANYQFEIVSENQWKKEFYYGYSISLLEVEMINISCQNYIQANSLPVIPIPFVDTPQNVWNASGNQTSPPDAMWLSCASYLEEYNDYATDFVPIFFQFLEIDYNFTLPEMEFLEAQFSRMQEALLSMDRHSNTIFNGLNLGNSYSLGLIADPYPPTNPLYATYFASISTSYLTYTQLGLLPKNTWEYNPRNVTVDTSTVAQDVWEYTPRNVSVEVNSTEIAEQIGYNETSIAENVWDYNNRTLTEFEFNVSVDTSEIAQSVWKYADRNLTNFDFEVKTGLINLSAQDVWEYANRNLTFTDDRTNYTLVATGVWEYQDRNLTSFDFVVDTGLYNLTPEEVWEYSQRNLTYYEPTTDETDYGLIQTYVWNATNRSLSEFNFLIDTGLYNLTPEEVWEYSYRNLTVFDFQVNTGLVNLTAQNVWEYSNRTLTEAPVNITQIADGVWTNPTRTLTDYNQSDLTNYTLIADLIVTNSNNLSAEEIWNYTVRNLTFFPEQLDLTNYTEIERLLQNVSNSDLINDIWNYTNRSIDAYPAHQYLGGTEYFANGDGKIAVRLVQAQGGNSTTETGADCNITILDPSDSVVVTDTMTEYGDGVYTYDFTVSSTLGVYTYYSNCQIEDRSYFGLNTFHVWDINETEISEDVWTYSTRDLTSTDDVTDYEKIQDYTWNATTRELTYYPTTNVTLSNDSIQELGDAVWLYEGNVSQNILSQFSNKIGCYLKNLWGIDNEWAVDISSC